MKKFVVLIGGRSLQGLEGLEAPLRDQPDIKVQRRHVTNGHMDPLHGVSPMPDLLVLDLEFVLGDELRAAARPAKNRPEVIAVGPDGNTRMMRLAMQAGARDFFTHPVPGQELLASIAQVADEHATPHTGAHSSVTPSSTRKAARGRARRATSRTS
jgi:pilus assembly protein CpaE